MNRVACAGLAVMSCGPALRQVAWVLATVLARNDFDLELSGNRLLADRAQNDR